LQAHKKAVIVFLPLVNAGDAASRSGSKTNHKSVFLGRQFCNASPALVPRHLMSFGVWRLASRVLDWYSSMQFVSGVLCIFAASRLCVERIRVHPWLKLNVGRITVARNEFETLSHHLRRVVEDLRYA
jgi:hypothetical protein